MPQLRTRRRRAQPDRRNYAGNIVIRNEPYPGEGIEKRIGSHIKPQENGCWFWNGVGHKPGSISWNGKTWRAHRLIWCMFHKVHEIPSHMHIHHECRNPGCVNPDHLELLTVAQHAQRHWGESNYRR